MMLILALVTQVLMMVMLPMLAFSKWFMMMMMNKSFNASNM
jgi:hypothetical protein